VESGGVESGLNVNVEAVVRRASVRRMMPISFMLLFMAFFRVLHELRANPLCSDHSAAAASTALRTKSAKMAKQGPHLDSFRR